MKKAIIKRNKKGRYTFLLKAANGNTIARSYPETYTQKHSVIATLVSCFREYEIEDKTINLPL